MQEYTKYYLLNGYSNTDYTVANYDLQSSVNFIINIALINLMLSFPIFYEIFLPVA